MKSRHLQASSLILKLTFFIILSLGIMTADHKYQHGQQLRKTIGLLILPIQYISMQPGKAVYWIKDNFIKHQELVDLNKILKEKNLFLESKLYKLKALENENKRILSLLGTSKVFQKHKVLIGEVISINLDPFRQQFLINKGSKHGVEVGQPVIDSHGVLGQVSSINYLSSTVILITDSAHSLLVESERTGMFILATGSGKNDELRLQHIPPNADLRIGDLLITSGLDKRYPKNYPVAEVTSIQYQKGDSFAAAKAKPHGKGDRGREILLIGKNNDQH